ncbi:MAG: tRNA pseudouridine(38-40) synthase TruA [Trueperaceae bacterium]|nr:tRNA pseudouridine(38-40) synthase TruA [Trueperaceae bacterium]
MVRRRVRLTLEFDGSEFAGWQWQPTGERTVQGAVQDAFARLPGTHGAVVAAGRTDAGVHALAMVAHVDTTTAIPDAKLRLAVNAHLPRDVVVLALETVAGDFEAQYDCRYRRYLYRMRPMRDDPRGLALERRRVLPVLRRVDVAAMQAATRHLLGTHDFSSFATQETRTPVRTLHLCDLRVEGAELRLHVAGDGFLRNMVRTIVGTLLWVGKGKLTADEVGAVLAARDRARAGPNVGPQGLYFLEAGYGPWDPAASEALAARRAPGAPLAVGAPGDEPRPEAPSSPPEPRTMRP